MGDQGKEAAAIKRVEGHFILWEYGDWVIRKVLIQVFISWLYEQAKYLTEYKLINKDLLAVN